MVELAEILSAQQPPAVDNGLLERIAVGQERMAQLMAAAPRGDAHDRALLERIAQNVLDHRPFVRRRWQQAALWRLAGHRVIELPVLVPHR